MELEGMGHSYQLRKARRNEDEKLQANIQILRCTSTGKVRQWHPQPAKEIFFFAPTTQILFRVALQVQDIEPTAVLSGSDP